MERHRPKGTVVAYAAPSPVAIIPLLGPAAREMVQALNIAPLEDGAKKAAPLTQDDLEQAAPDFEVKARSQNVEHAVRPVTSQRAPAPPTGAGPIPAPADAALPADCEDLVDLSRIQEEEKRARILEMLAPHKDMWSGDLGKIRATEHDIDLKPNTRPIHQQPYRAGAESPKVHEDHINLQLAADLIEPDQSEWASPVLLAPKKDGTLRYCIDFRRLNTVTTSDTYPLPRMGDCIDSLVEARFFKTLDAMCGYWQVPIAEGDRDKTTFTSHMGTFRYKRMRFGLRNAPAIFQRALDIVLSPSGAPYRAHIQRRRGGTIGEGWLIRREHSGCRSWLEVPDGSDLEDLNGSRHRSTR